MKIYLIFRFQFTVLIVLFYAGLCILGFVRVEMIVTRSENHDYEERFQINMLKIKQHLEYYDTKIYDHNFFKNYLLKCDNDVMKCLEKIDSFFVLKKMFPEYLLHDDIRCSDFNHFCRSIYSCYLPELNTDGCRIFIDKVSSDESLFDVLKIMKYYCMQTELRFLEDEPDNGDIILFDCNNINLLHIIAFVPYFIKSLQIILKVYPLRVQLLVLTNVGRVVKTVINTLKWFTPKRYHDLVYVYSEGSEHFSKHVPVIILPKEYGGNTFTLDEIRENWYQKLQQRRPWFQKANDEITNLKYNKFKNFRFIFGKNGTFKTLQLD
ncbi:alpha-tocopherol transfer protein-like isoform X1 [Planococcus citri]|uniref:alpha-tocopherol transfer protein-like isoform X1 n=1 Tax=Planococcus citri TaxID=170843 RepID=UPI0031F850A4